MIFERTHIFIPCFYNILAVLVHKHPPSCALGHLPHLLQNILLLFFSTINSFSEKLMIKNSINSIQFYNKPVDRREKCEVIVFPKNLTKLKKSHPVNSDKKFYFKQIWRRKSFLQIN